MVLELLTADERARAHYEFGVAADPAWFMITPRFRASSHVIVLLLAEATGRPALAMKIARLSGDGASLDREAARLRQIEASRPGGYDSVPRVVGYGERRRHAVLLETALNGVPMDARVVRRNQSVCCDRMTTWLVEFHGASRMMPRGDWHERLIETPLDRLTAVLGRSADDARLIDETRQRLAALASSDVPLVCEHGDVSHPNLLLTAGGDVGVLDWETSNPAGLPGCDLFFFLTYIAFARRGRWQRQAHTAAFDDAFFGRSAWAQSYVQRYANSLALSPAAIGPLFLATWPRYLAGLLERLGEHGAPEGRSETAAWLRSNRFYALWRHAVGRFDQLRWNVGVSHEE